MFDSFISKTYNNIPQILAFMSFNQGFMYGDFRGFIVLLGLFVNYIFYRILNVTTELIYGTKQTGMPSINTQFLFFYMGFHIAYMSSKMDTEYSHIKAVYLCIVAAIAMFIKSVVGPDKVVTTDNPSGRILGAVIGLIIGMFFYTLVSYKYNIKGEDEYNKKYKVCKGGEQYQCKINDYDQLKEDALKDEAKKNEEVKKETTILDTIINDCESCNQTIR